MRKHRPKAIVLLSLLFLLVMTGTVFALSGPTYYGGWVGTSVVAQKDIEVGGSSWNGKIDSYTQYRNPIGTIGWTY